MVNVVRSTEPNMAATEYAIIENSSARTPELDR
jgi:hypothetical protein